MWEMCRQIWCCGRVGQCSSGGEVPRPTPHGSNQSQRAVTTALSRQASARQNLLTLIKQECMKQVGGGYLLNIGS